MLKFLMAAGVVGLASALALPLAARPTQPVAATAVQQALDDPTIVAIFDVTNTADIETGELAAKQASNADVRALGAQFARDHRMVRQQGRDLAKKLGVKPTLPAGDKSAQQTAAVLKDLKARHGADFDKAYLAHEVQFHQQVIDALNTTLLPAIKNAELKDLVQKVVPAFQAHLAAAKNLQQKLGM